MKSPRKLERNSFILDVVTDAACCNAKFFLAVRQTVAVSTECVVLGTQDEPRYVDLRPVPCA